MRYHSTAVREAASGRWVEVCARLGIDTSLFTPRHGRCPGGDRCPGNDGNSGSGGTKRFRYDDIGGRGTWICSGQFSGDGLALIEHCLGVDWKEATELAGDALGLPVTGRANGEMGPRKLVEPAPAPQPQRDDGRLKFDVGALRRFFKPELGINRNWLRDRSPVRRPADLSSGEYLDAVFAPGERVLVFQDFRSQGDYLWEAGARGGFRLGQRPGIRAVPSALPKGGGDGIWYLCQPVSGQWSGNGQKLSRRSQGNVERWPHLVLESDEAPEEEWLCFLVRLQLPIKAIYTSGGRSIHALVHLEAKTKGDWDCYRKAWLPLLSRCGADAGALTAVRLTRLPGCRRGNRPQELLYLDPSPDPMGTPIIERV